MNAALQYAAFLVLDPQLSPSAARAQVTRIAHVRGLDEAALHELVQRHIEPRTFGIFGEPRVNVLLLNRALAELAASGTHARPP